MCAIGAAPEIEQMRRRELPDLLVVGEHAVAFDARVIVAVDHDERRAARRQLLQQSVLPEPCAEARTMPSTWRPRSISSSARSLPGSSLELHSSRPKPRDAGDRLDAGDDLDEERVHQIGDDDAERVGAAEAEAAGDGVALVAELFDLGEDAGAGRLADVGVVVQHLRDGRDRDAELAGDPLHRGRVHAVLVLRIEPLSLKCLDFTGKA